jgi:hypothetical protein
MLDPVNPTHYARLQPQPIEVIESWQLGPHAANVLKYLARAGHKDGTPELDDLRKAKWYLDRLLWLAEQKSTPAPAPQPHVEERRERESVPTVSVPAHSNGAAVDFQRVAQDVCRR